MILDTAPPHGVEPYAPRIVWEQHNHLATAQAECLAALAKWIVLSFSDSRLRLADRTLPFTRQLVGQDELLYALDSDVFDLDPVPQYDGTFDISFRRIELKPPPSDFD